MQFSTVFNVVFLMVQQPTPGQIASVGQGARFFTEEKLAAASECIKELARR